jgi:hypothetical protein
MEPSFGAIGKNFIAMEAAPWQRFIGGGGATSKEQATDLKRYRLDHTFPGTIFPTAPNSLTNVIGAYRSFGRSAIGRIAKRSEMLAHSL